MCLEKARLLYIFELRNSKRIYNSNLNLIQAQKT